MHTRTHATPRLRYNTHCLRHDTHQFGEFETVEKATENLYAMFQKTPWQFVYKEKKSVESHDRLCSEGRSKEEYSVCETGENVIRKRSTYFRQMLSQFTDNTEKVTY